MVYIQVPGAWFIHNGERYKVLKAKIGNSVWVK